MKDIAALSRILMHATSSANEAFGEGLPLSKTDDYVYEYHHHRSRGVPDSRYTPDSRAGSDSGAGFFPRMLLASSLGSFLAAETSEELDPNNANSNVSGQLNSKRDGFGFPSFQMYSDPFGSVRTHDPLGFKNIKSNEII